MGQRTPLYDEHLAAKAKVVDFGGWDMPLHYGSQLNEHNVVREAVGMFDVSHMTVVDIAGPQAQAYLQRLLANDVARLTEVGKALYSCMLNEAGGVIDDLIAYFFTTERYRLVVNASTRDKDIAWMQKQAAGFDVQVTERADLGMIAVQGPQARAKVAELLPDYAEQLLALKTFFAIEATIDGHDWLLAQTGYTGEDGLEIVLPAEAAVKLWQQLIAAGVQPCGLGCRDTLRLEAGMALYGHEMEEDISPLAAGLNWTIAWKPEERDFIGRKALEQQKADGVKQKQIGLVLTGRGVLRGDYEVQDANGNRGVLTSGGFGPTLQGSMGLARVDADFATDECEVLIRNKPVAARIVKPPFVRNGKALV